ncbi:MAG TPA: 2-phospho-L-lactate transferase [Ilumatobacteraceae bacterium]|nr:2-phospho-L-lactate transferase [Ilumatobacteraceae bacterium]
MIAVLCGGVGAARFLRGLALVADPAQTTAIVNVADDTVLHGLSISPDIDTIIYTLAGAIDPDRGWGLVDETWQALDALRRYERVRPPRSTAGSTWFGLGDRDLATHLYRTARLAEGALLGQVTGEIAQAWGLDQQIVPVTDDRLRTVLTVGPNPILPIGTAISFQEYFVRYRHDVPVSAVRFAGADTAVLSERAAQALTSADVVVIAPSNPIVSIGPLLAVDGVRRILAARRQSVVAISPLVGGKALKGPADRLMDELGHRSDAVGVAAIYREIAGTLVIDELEAKDPRRAHCHLRCH